mmetsp:Transcript_33539/g.61653  ORF Transcript_33539/g.61653 Transcript_33539/m.61653 type:complete len:126 (+) Transcript_33539:1-378(+)
MKRGYAFVFLKDPESLAEKERAEVYVAEINGMYVDCRIIVFFFFFLQKNILSSRARRVSLSSTFAVATHTGGGEREIFILRVFVSDPPRTSEVAKYRFFNLSSRLFSSVFYSGGGRLRCKPYVYM